MLKQISPDTAIKLAEQLGVSIEELVHMPRHILMQKLAQLAKEEQDHKDSDNKESNS